MSRKLCKMRHLMERNEDVFIEDAYSGKLAGCPVCRSLIRPENVLYKYEDGHSRTAVCPTCFMPEVLPGRYLHKPGDNDQRPFNWGDIKRYHDFYYGFFHLKKSLNCEFTLASYSNGMYIFEITCLVPADINDAKHMRNFKFSAHKRCRVQRSLSEPAPDLSKNRSKRTQLQRSTSIDSWFEERMKL